MAHGRQFPFVTNTILANAFFLDLAFFFFELELLHDGGIRVR